MKNEKTVNLAGIKSKVAEIFSEMKNSETTTFGISLAEEAMEILDCKQIRASSGKKVDLFVAIHDRISPIIRDLGFSIKSMLGSPATLVNASGATNFVYKITESGERKEKNELREDAGALKVRDITHDIYDSGRDLEFCGMDSENFRKNLIKIDSKFPEIMAEILKLYYNGEGAKLTDLVECLAEDEKAKEKFGLSKSDYEYKVKQFLTAAALGMMPAKIWNGFTEAHGGYIIVKENGEVVCYHLYDRNEFENYLYHNTKLDTPSTTRHAFGSVYEEGGEKRIKYNLQVRFIK